MRRRRRKVRGGGIVGRLISIAGDKGMEIEGWMALSSKL
jgi:hypothetical protein